MCKFYEVFCKYFALKQFTMYLVIFIMQFIKFAFIYLQNFYLYDNIY